MAGVVISPEAKAAIEAQKALLRLGLRVLRDQVTRAKTDQVNAEVKIGAVLGQLTALEKEFPGIADELPKEGVVVLGVKPAGGSQGQTVNAQIVGFNFAGATGVNFGNGVTTSDLTVADDGKAIGVKVKVSSSAEATPRDVKVTTPEGQGALLGGFQVNPAE